MDKEKIIPILRKEGFNVKLKNNVVTLLYEQKETLYDQYNAFKTKLVELGYNSSYGYCQSTISDKNQTDCTEFYDIKE